MYINPQYDAILIEKIGHFPYQSANEIRKDPIGYLDRTCLDRIERISEEKRKEVCAFWDKYQSHAGKSLDEIGEDIAQELIDDFQNLCT